MAKGLKPSLIPQSEMVERYNSGETIQEIAKLAGLSMETTSKRIKNDPNYIPREVKIDNLDINEVAIRIINGETVRQLCRSYKCSDHDIYNLVQKNGYNIHHLKKKLDFDQIVSKFVHNEGTYAEIAMHFDINEKSLVIRLKVQGYNLDELRKRRNKDAIERTNKLILMNAEYHHNNMHQVRCRGCRIRSDCETCWYRSLYFLRKE